MRIALLRSQYERQIDALTPEQQREALLWLRLITHEAYSLIYLGGEEVTAKPMNAAQVLTAVEHLLAQGQDLIQDDGVHLPKL
jgi:hypothetical protein